MGKVPQKERGCQRKAMGSGAAERLLHDQLSQKNRPLKPETPVRAQSSFVCPRADTARMGLSLSCAR